MIVAAIGERESLSSDSQSVLVLEGDCRNAGATDEHAVGRGSVGAFWPRDWGLKPSAMRR